MRGKFFAVLAGVLSAVFLLSSCAAPAVQTSPLDPNHPVSLEIWHYYNGPQKTAFDNLVAQFNDTVGLELGIIVEAFSQGNVGALAEKVLDSAHSRVGAEPMPDIFAAYADTAYEVEKLGLLADLDTYFTPEELAAYRPEFIDEGRFSADGALSIFPIAKSVELMMVNTTDWQPFADATGAQLGDLATMEGVTRTAEAYYTWSDGKALFGRDAMANYMLIGCRQLGAPLFTPVDDGITLTADKAALRRLWDNYYVPMVNGWFSSNGRFRSDEANLGGIIALVGSSSAVAYFPKEVSLSDSERYPIDCAVLRPPVFEGGESYAIQQGAGMSVAKNDASHECAAGVFLKWFTDTPQNVIFAAASGGYLPVKNAALDLALIDEALVSTDLDAEALSRMRLAFSAALDVLSDHTLYTPRPFPGGVEARSILEASLNDLAKEDRQTVLNLIASGHSRDEALEQVGGDARFNLWFDQLTTSLNEALSHA